MLRAPLPHPPPPPAPPAAWPPPRRHHAPAAPRRALPRGPRRPPTPAAHTGHARARSRAGHSGQGCWRCVFLHALCGVPRTHTRRPCCTATQAPCQPAWRVAAPPQLQAHAAPTRGFSTAHLLLLGVAVLRLRLLPYDVQHAAHDVANGQLCGARTQRAGHPLRMLERTRACTGCKGPMLLPPCAAAPPAASQHACMQALACAWQQFAGSQPVRAPARLAPCGRVRARALTHRPGSLQLVAHGPDVVNERGSVGVALHG